MAFLSVAHEDVAAPRAGSALQLLARSFQSWRQQCARRHAMLALLDMEPWRLDDLGVSIDAVRDALARR